MSIGEVINLYKDGELKIDPVFQRIRCERPTGMGVTPILNLD